jgi:O-succinylbenzoic acid--CoA ligase
MDFDAWLPRSAALRPDHPALVDDDGTVTTYAQLHAAARRTAAALAERGVGEGDRVAVALPPGLPYVATLHALLGLGATLVPLDARLSDDERAHRARGAALTVEAPLDTGDPGAPERPLRERLDPDAVATLLHTSGTTAAPKPVALTVSNWQWNALGSALALGLDRDERWLCTLPLSHVGGLSILIRSAVYGTTVVLHERFDADRVAAALASEQQRITLVSLVATTLRRTLDAGLDRPPHLRCALIGGGPLAPALQQRAAEAGVAAAQTYGMTEACSQVTTSLPGEPETAGRPLTGQQVAISDDGEILVRGATVARGALAADGWLHTGDLGALDARGRLTVTGRRSDTIVSGGENVAPQEVEAVLLEHPAVADAGVHGRPDPEWGEAVVATVVVRDGHAADDALVAALRAHVGGRLARFKVPKQVAFAAELPRTASGKLLRRQLR